MALLEAIMQPKLRVFRQLDPQKLGPEATAYFTEKEDLKWVDGDLARDVEWTQEIMGATIGAALVDERGQFVAKFSGKDSIVKAEKARLTARVTFDVSVDETDADVEDEPAQDADSFR